MRTSFVLGVVSVLALSSFGIACSQPVADDSSLAQRRANSSDGTDDGSSTDDTQGNDGQPSVGEHDTTPGNPNATSTPTAPTTTPTASSQFALAISNNTPAADIGDSVQVPITITPANGFTGAVQIAVSGLPDGATADPVSATVSNGAASAMVTIKVGFGTAATEAGASSALTFTGTGGGVSATAPANFKVNPHVQLNIPMNIDALRKAGNSFVDDWGTAFGTAPTTLLTQADNAIVVNVFNNDSKGHIIHAGTPFGGHGDTNNPIQPNAFEQLNGAKRDRALKPGTNATGYPHDGTNGAGASFQVKIGTAPATN